MAWILSQFFRFKMAAVLTEEPRLEKESTNEMPEDGDDEVEDLQEANEVSSSKKKKKKKKKKKGQFSLIVKHVHILIRDGAMLSVRKLKSVF